MVALALCDKNLNSFNPKFDFVANLLIVKTAFENSPFYNYIVKSCPKGFGGVCVGGGGLRIYVCILTCHYYYMYVWFISLKIYPLNITRQNTYKRNVIRVSNSLYQDLVGPGLDPNCLQLLSADDTSRQVPAK